MFHARKEIISSVVLLQTRPLLQFFSCPQVIIIAHVPFGYLPFARDATAVRQHQNERMVSILRMYSHVIAGHFYGHTHQDSLMVLLDPGGRSTRGCALPHYWHDQ